MYGAMRLDGMKDSGQQFAKLVIVFGAVLSVAPLRLAAQDRSANPLPGTILVGADGKYEAEPDTVLVQFNISAQDETVKAASDRASRSAEQVRDLLRKNGIDPKQAQVGQFAIEPVYDYRNPKRKLLGYRANTGITIKLKEFAKVGPITQGLSDLDVTDNQSLTYTLENMDNAKVKAVEDALRKGKDMANAVAISSGRALGSLSYASVDTYEPHPIRPAINAMAMKAEAPAALPATEEFGTQKITVTAHVNALYNLQ